MKTFDPDKVKLKVNGHEIIPLGKVRVNQVINYEEHKVLSGTVITGVGHLTYVNWKTMKNLGFSFTLRVSIKIMTWQNKIRGWLSNISF